MAVLLETSLGEMVVDLFTDKCPLACKSFIKLCKIKYYNNCLFHNVQKDFIVQTGDPTGTGKGGDSIYKFLYGEQARFFDDEIDPKARHDKVGLVALASAGNNLNASQFYITTRASIDSLDGKHTIFGEIAEGLDTLMRINEAYVDDDGRPYKNIRIKHTHILDDPIDDPPGLEDLIPPKSPELKPPAEGEEIRLEDDWVPMDEGKDEEELEQEIRKKEAHSRAVVLEMVGDLPEADVKPPENVLFVCRLNPVTQDEDLEIIFSRFGKIVSADVIRDFKTGDSLCYAFIEFETKEASEAAYFKMDNVLIDDRRIHVDFSQSVGRLWNRFRKFGTKDSATQGGGDFGPKAKSQGCFKCGEHGHFARECPNSEKMDNNNQEEEEKEPVKPKYELKDTGGQIGGSRRSYGLVFEEESEDGEKSGLKGRKFKGEREYKKATSPHKQERKEGFYSTKDHRRAEEQPREHEPRRERERYREIDYDNSDKNDRKREREERREERTSKDVRRHCRDEDRTEDRDNGGYDERRSRVDGRGRREYEDNLNTVKRSRYDVERQSRYDGERESRRGYERGNGSSRKNDSFEEERRQESKSKSRREEDSRGHRERYDKSGSDPRGRRD